MKTKLKYLIKNSLSKKMKTKWFVIANIILFVVIAGLINIDSIIKFFGGDFNDKLEIMVIDNIGSYEEFKSTYEIASETLDLGEVEITKYDKTYEDALDEIKEEDKILIELNADKTNFVRAKLVSNDNIDVNIYQLITTTINSIKRDIALKHYNISDNILALIDAKVEIERIKLDDNKNADEMLELIMGTIFPLIILPFFMLTMFLVQMIGAEINEEKTTKGMEIIISNVSPTVHFASKIIAGNVFVLAQGLLLILYVVLGLGIRFVSTGAVIGGEVQTYVGDIINSLKISGVLPVLSKAIPLTIILMLITFLAYSLVAGILASMTTNMEDFQQLQTPIIIVSLVAYYLSMMAAMFEGSLFIKILGFVPFISSLLAPALLVLGQFSIVDMVISILITCATVFLLYKYGIKIYKVGILNYSQNNLWKKMFKAARN
ncbi:MAG: ABC transporter permease [Bacilli bacterium]